MKQLDIFFNTVKLSGSDLAEATRQADCQNGRVLDIIRKAGRLTPFQVSSIYDKLYDPAPVTSIRRSMTVLTKQGKLAKCDEMKTERYGMKNHYWRVV